MIVSEYETLHARDIYDMTFCIGVGFYHGGCTVLVALLRSIILVVLPRILTLVATPRLLYLAALLRHF